MPKVNYENYSRFDVIHGYAFMPEYRVEFIPMSDAEYRKMQWYRFKETCKEALLFTLLWTGAWAGYAIAIGSILTFFK